MTRRSALMLVLAALAAACGRKGDLMRPGTDGESDDS
ncbi:MAG: lipoprotein [bacterium]|nr:lipoprotein [bacterium]MDE0239941.1 lipoprotein [bacterium]MDE0416174.1 lipoprotein [bacterium]